MKKESISLRNNRGVTFVTLVVAVLMMVIISSVLVVNGKSGNQIQRLKSMQNDVSLLQDKITLYYAKYGTIPANIEFAGDTTFEPGPNDGGKYYVVDLSLLDGVTLNFGDDYSKIQSSDDTKDKVRNRNVYIVNEQSLRVYYVRGISVENNVYYTTGEDKVNDGIKLKTSWSLKLEEIGPKNVKLTLHSINYDIPYTYTAYVNGKVVKSGTTVDRVVDIYEGQTQFEVGIKEENTYVVIQSEGKEYESNHVSKADTAIATLTEFIKFRDNVNKGNSYDGQTIQLASDIDLQGSESNQWVPIANGSSKLFKGTFDGNGYTIKNLYINNSSNYQGLFCYNYGIIKNVSVEGDVTTAGSKISGLVYSNYGTVDNCKSFVNCTAFIQIGGIVYLNYGTVIRCSNYGDCTITAAKSSTGVIGGIVGYLESGSVEMCYNSKECTITADSNSIGGIVGSVISGDINLCYNEGNINNTGKSATGGICGYVYENTNKITNCYNVGVINGQEKVGGIVGNSVTGIINNCYNAGAITGTKNIGSICGANSTSIENSYGLSYENSTIKLVGMGNGTVENCSLMTATQMQSADFASKLGMYFKYDASRNNGYPILAWQ